MKTYKVFIPGTADTYYVKADSLRRDDKECLVFYAAGGINKKTGKGFAGPIAFAPKDAVVYIIADDDQGPITTVPESV